MTWDDDNLRTDVWNEGYAAGRSSILATLRAQIEGLVIHERLVAPHGSVRYADALDRAEVLALLGVPTDPPEEGECPHEGGHVFERLPQIADNPVCVYCGVPTDPPEEERDG